MPGEVAPPGRPSIVLAQMDMPQVCAGGANCIADAVFFDIHVERIQQDLDTGALHLLHVGYGFSGGIEKELLEAIDYLQYRPKVMEG